METLIVGSIVGAAALWMGRKIGRAIRLPSFGRLPDVDGGAGAGRSADCDPGLDSRGPGDLSMGGGCDGCPGCD